MFSDSGGLLNQLGQVKTITKIQEGTLTRVIFGQNIAIEISKNIDRFVQR